MDRQACAEMVNGTEGGNAYFHYAVWNRTGMVLFEEFPVPVTSLGKPFAVTFELPRDYPFLVQPMFCSAGVKLIVEFEAHHAYAFRSGAPGSVETTWHVPAYWVNVTIPPGERVGEARFVQDGNIVIINIGPLLGMVQQRGAVFAELPMEYRFYEPGKDGDDWAYHGWKRGPDRGLALNRIVHNSGPGEYLVRIEMDLPAVVPVTWQVGLQYGEWTPAMTGHGFEHPFRMYAEMPMR